MSIIGTLLGFVLTVFILLLIARMVLDWAGLLSSGSPWVRRARVIANAGTDR
jgi:YggT family protein